MSLLQKFRKQRTIDTFGVPEEEEVQTLEEIDRTQLLADEFDTVEPDLEDFTRLRTLGTGTFGRVYLVRNKNNNKCYSLKVLKKLDVVRMKQVEHVKNEKQILMAIDCPFVVTIYKTYNDMSNLYILAEYVIGGELFSHLRKMGRFPVDIARFLIAQVVLALEYMHKKNIVYRDLKPENILLTNNGYIKIVDFGFSKFITDRTWTLCGTPEYLAPEMIQSKGHGKAVDWWALGVLLYEVLAGFPPFFDDNPFGIYEKILANTPMFPDYMNKSAKDLIKKLLSTDRTRRIGNLKGGADDIKKHRFFKGFDWKGLSDQTLKSPFKILVNGPDDSSYFDTYPEVDDEEPVSVDPFRFIFRNF